MAMIGHRLRLSRSAAGLSLRQLQTRIDHRVSAQAISKYERNESMPSSGVLIALADALDVSVDYLAGDEDLVLEAVEFRKKRLTGKRQEARVEARVLHLLERYLMVEEILGLPSVAWDKPREAPWPVVRNLSEAEQSALGLRIHWGLGQDPIPNLVELLEERGIKVLAMDLLDIDGLTARVRRETGAPAAVVVVNRRDWGERQRFTVAHELGHMVLDVSPKLKEEKAAHRFAGAFLMPAETLRAEVGKHRKSMGWSELFELKRIFGVSVQVSPTAAGTSASSATRCSGFCSTSFPAADGAAPLTRSPMPRRARSRGVSNDCASAPCRRRCLRCQSCGTPRNLGPRAEPARGRAPAIEPVAA